MRQNLIQKGRIFILKNLIKNKESIVIGKKAIIYQINFVFSRINKLLADQKLYNTNEIKKKKQESTRTFFREIQLNKTKKARQDIIEEQAEKLKAEIDKKNRISQIAKQNLNIAQYKMNQMRIQKAKGRIFLYQYFQNINKKEDT